MKPKTRLRAWLLGAATMAAISWQCVLAHGLLSPEVMQNMLVELQTQQLRIAEQSDPGAKAEALFLLGSRVRSITDLLNQDLAVHGQVDPLAMMFVKHLASMGMTVETLGKDGRFRYDLDAFHQYLKLSPRGANAAEARFVILDHAFRLRTIDVAAPLGTDEETAARHTLPEYERYLHDFPHGPHVREVRFYLGVECHRLALHTGANPERSRLRACARQALNEVATTYSGSIEARAASTLLEELTSVR